MNTILQVRGDKDLTLGTYCNARWTVQAYPLWRSFSLFSTVFSGIPFLSFHLLLLAFDLMFQRPTGSIKNKNAMVVLVANEQYVLVTHHKVCRVVKHHCVGECLRTRH